MGEQKVIPISNREKRGEFTKHLLDDVKALEIMLEQGLIEKGITRVGLEQEFCLVDEHWRPSRISDTILKQIDDSHFTTELARYNLEINLDPVVLSGDCFSEVEHQLTSLLNKAHGVADANKNRIILTGILPTIGAKELDMSYMTPAERYYTLNKMIREVRGRDFELRIRGVDEVALKHDSILFEACNTSFQLHLQIDPEDFASSFNWAQAISGPVLGICANSPLLLGKELWKETRIALFQQSIDMRTSAFALKDQQARVAFGRDWAKGSIADIYKNDIAEYEVLIAREISYKSTESLENGAMPKLPALMLHNGTVYRWNRPCFGVHNNVAHVRIENRYIPSGPTVMDEMANFVFWIGLMKGRPATMDRISELMDFREAKENFIKAARTGKNTVLTWMGIPISVRDLVLNELLPIAHNGLQKMGVSDKDRNRFLKVIEERARNGTGAQWIQKTYRNLTATMKQDRALVNLTSLLHKHERSGLAVHDWPEYIPGSLVDKRAEKVGHVMSTQLFTVNEDDPASLATTIMDWKDIHHMPVINGEHRLTGLLTWTHMNRHKEAAGDASDDSLVSDIMTREVITIAPGDTIKDAIKIMKQHEIGCLPVLQNNILIGIITIKDVLAYDRA